MKTPDIILFGFRGFAVICLAGTLLHIIEGNWIAAVVFFCLGTAASILVALAGSEGP